MVLEALTEQARRFRYRAEEIRSLGDTFRHSGMRQILYGVAADYERMAATLDRIEAIKKGMTNENGDTIN